MKNGYNYDAINNTVTISSTFAKKASQVGTPEYEIMLKLRKDYPNLKVEKETKTGKAQLTYKTMEDFIKLHRNSESLLKGFAGAKTLSKFHSMPFSFVKDWFMKTFPYFKDGSYEMDENGFIVAKPSEKKEEETSAERETSVQTMKVLKNQDVESADTESSENADNSPLAEAV